MQKSIRVSSNVELRGGFAFGVNLSEFPENPQLGQMTFKDGVLYGYQLVGGLQTWYPLSNPTRSYVHTQGLASGQWVVHHSLGTPDTWYQVQDLYGHPMICSRTIVDENTFTLDFTEPVEGNCIVIAPDSISVPEVQAAILTAGTASIGGGVVELNAGGAWVAGSPVLTEATGGSGAGTLVGNLSDLTTVTKTNSVAAINEVRALTLQGDSALSSALETKVDLSLLGAQGGVATLDSSGLVHSSQLPSYVDDVIEVSDMGALPLTGETGKIYVTLDTNKCYRWSGTTYTYITSGAVDSVAGKTGVVTLTKDDVSLSLVDNVADANKPVSGPQTTAINAAAAAAAIDATNKANAAKAASAPVSHVGAGGAVHAAAVPNGDAGFITGADQAKLNAITGTNTGDQIIPTTLPASDVYAWAKAAAKPVYTPAEVGSPSGSGTSTGTNTGDETTATIKTKLGIATLSGVNTGDQTTITGNAGTATKLVASVNINGVAFDGGSSITINAVDATARVATSLLGAANGVATLDATSKVPASQLPSYVDDVLEFANLAAFPGTGEAGKIYVALDTNKCWRWSGSAYIFITSGAVDSVAGKTGVVLLTKTDVGLPLVDNTADASKPVSTAQAAANTAVQTAAASDATTKANAAQAAAIAASAPVAHVGAGGAAHANAVANGAAGFITGANQAKLDGLTIGTTVQPYDPLLSSVIGQNSKSTDYTCVLADSGKHLLHPSADTTARIFTIPSNAAVAYPIGTAIMFINQNGGGAITIGITTDTMRLAGPGTTGNRTLAANGIATAIKVTATEWLISGTNLS